MIIGFGNGNFWRMETEKHERFGDEALRRFLNIPTNAIELHCLDVEAIDYLLKNKSRIIEDFDFVSMHTPDLVYDDNAQTHSVLQKMARACEECRVDNIVFHTDKVKQWDVIAQYNGMMPVSIENMDERKKFGNTLEDIQSILDHYNFGLTLDLQHCYVNDASMQLAQDLQEAYKERIVEYHLAGYDVDKLHYPLYKTKQDIILKSLQCVDAPIIIESTFDAYDEASAELKYIKSFLG